MEPASGAALALACDVRHAQAHFTRWSRGPTAERLRDRAVLKLRAGEPIGPAPAGQARTPDTRRGFLHALSQCSAADGAADVS